MDTVMKKLIDAGVYLKDEVIRQKALKEKLKRLGDNRPKIQSVVAYASTQLQIKDQNPDLDTWLWQLRDAVDEVDDVLDDWEYMKHKEQLEETQVRCIICHLFDCAHKIGKRAVKFGLRALNFDPDQERLEAAVKKLDEVSTGVGTFIHLVEAANQEQQKQQEELYRARETGAMPKNDQIGRAKQKDSVLQWLTTKPSNEQQTPLIAGTTNLYKNISLLSIVGHGGMGKTTLLQHVYQDIKKTKEFDPYIWVCVSNNFDAKKVIIDMLEYLKKERPRLETLATLQESLKSEVTSKKFLLVLDDIWDIEEERNKSKWEDVLAPLASGELGSKILITTRSDLAASMIAKVINKKKEILSLEGLKEAECLQLLNNHAFAGENPDDHRKLKSIVGEIVKKLSGSPLAAKVIGGVLNSSLDESHWIKILNNVFTSAESAQSDIMPILRLSYIFLPKHLQSCFAFCCIFPQDHRFNKDDLIRMWIALGFVQSSDNRGEVVEDIGGRYFDILVKKTFFDKLDDFEYYKMHDLLHELAQSVSARECFRVEGDKELLFKIPETIRHLSVETNNLQVLKKMGKFKNLRTLYISYNKDIQDFVDVLAEIFEASIRIRLLYIEDQHLKIIPKAIEKLMHLRYLKIVNTRVTLLPRSLNNFYHLKFITHSPLKDVTNAILPNGASSASWMNEFQMFYNLEYIKVENCYMWETLPPFGQLPSLKSLYLRNIPKAKWIDYRFSGNDKDCAFPSLQVLEIFQLEALEDWFDARPATDDRLFPCLTDLCLEHCPNLRELPSLPPKLKKLTINNMGWKTLNWLKGTSNYCSISIENCSNLPHLSGRITENCQLILNDLHINDPFMLVMEPLGKTISLEKLAIKYNDAMVSFPVQAEQWFTRFSSSLCELKLHRLESLQSLPSLESLSSLAILEVAFLFQLQVLPNLPASLKKLDLFDLQTLQSLPSSLESLSSLKILKMWGVPQLHVLPNLPASLEELELRRLESLQSLPSSLESLSSLKILKVDSVLLLQVLPNLPASLEELHLYELKSLQYLPSLESLSSLAKLEVIFLSQLQVLPNLPTSLKILSLINLESLQSFPSSFESFSSLEILEVKGVPQLQVFPHLPASLEKLTLEGLYSLQSLPSSLESLSSLKILMVDNVPIIQVLPNLPASLKQLTLRRFYSLQSLPSSLESLSSLKILEVWRVPQLQVLPNLPASLDNLRLGHLYSLDCLPSCLPSLSSLQTLIIAECPRLSELPGLPPSLKSLSINRCLPELTERYRQFAGSDWHKIADIPHVHID